uniref:Uncharacterized protein n=1 Tax=Stomoxys calcitrans TaxID=35570 RepID=A0A1I8NP26_STOCA
MSVFVVLLLMVVTCLLGVVTGAPIELVSYIEDLNVSFENDKWICGGITCPSKTFGCRVQRLTDTKDDKMLHSIYICFDENKLNVKVEASITEMVKPRKIDINLESYVGAVSVFSSGYGLGGHENAKGTVSPGAWNELKETAKQNKNTVDESNAAFE